MSMNERVKQRLKASLKQQSNGLLNLAILFKEFDIDGSGKLSWEEFCSALQKCGLAPSPQDIRTLFLELDKDGDNEISYKEFIQTMRGNLSKQRKVLIKQVFDSIDSDEDGLISFTDIGQNLNPKNHPDVKIGRKTVHKFLEDFFDSLGTVSDTGYITMPQFMEYYENSAAFDDDMRFTDNMKTLWKCFGNYESEGYMNKSLTSSSVGDIFANTDVGVAKNLEKVRNQLISRGAKGIIGLQRKFRIMDDDGNKSLNLFEFKKGIRECGIHLTDLQMSQLFGHFDKDRNGSISFDEFIQAVRGEMNSRRKRLVNLAFGQLDRDGSGEVEPEEIVRLYDASKHPEVLAGRRRESDVLREFLDTFDVGGVKDGKVTQGEFENYYANLSASVDDDDYFELMIRNAWRISGGEGQAANTANRRVLVTRADGSQAVEEIKDELGLRADDKKGMMARLKAQGVEAAAVSLYGGDQQSKNRNRGVLEKAEAPLSLSQLRLESARNSEARDDVDLSALRIASAGPYASFDFSRPSSRPGSAPINPGLFMLIKRLKQEMRQRGSAGFIGLQRKFRIMDDDGSKSLNLAEFKKGMKEMALSLSDAELRMMFDHFDSNGNGSIDFEEFVQGVRDPLSERRLVLVQKAFNKLDKDGSGFVDAQEIAGMYDASKHPEVIAGRRTSQEILEEFLDTFDVGGVKDGMVTQGEFINYYTNLGANIDSDDYFELMIRNAWHISGGEGLAANSANRRVLVTLADGSQKVEEIKDDMGLNLNDKTAVLERLRAQGVKATNMSKYEPVGDFDHQMKPPPRASKLGDIRPPPAQFFPPPPPPVQKTKEEIVASRGPTHARPAAVKTTFKPVVGPPPPVNPGLQMILNRIKVAMKARGATGFIGLQRKFRVMDDDGSRSLSLAEFKKGMKETKIELSDPELRMVFTHFDANHNGSIDFEEFIQGIRDPLTERRLKLVKMAFSKLDTDGSGIVDAEEVAALYDASKHPDVLSGRRTARQVLTEFLDTFDVGGVKDGMVTEGEFINYYTNLGANIDNEDYFELMIRNAWRISGGEGLAANTANRRILVTRADGSQTVEEIKDDLGGDKAEMMARLRKSGIYAVDVSPFDGQDPAENITNSDQHKRKNVSHFRTTIPSGVLPGTIPPNSKPSPTKAKSNRNGVDLIATAPVGVRVLVKRLKEEMLNRGGTGFIMLQRKFRIMDDDGSTTLNYAEFKKGISEMRMGLNDAEIRTLFKHFDLDDSQTIDFEEFIQGVREPLTPRRMKLVKLAFDKLDTNGNGIVDAGEIASKYDASRHPEVIAGRMTPNEVLAQFLDTFDVGGVKDGMVTEGEFINYYTNLGANIENEDYFELMIRNAWHISGGEGQAANSANRRVLVTRPDGTEVVEEIKDDLGLRAGDHEGMRARLKAQGVDSSSLATSGFTEMGSPSRGKVTNLGQLSRSTSRDPAGIDSVAGRKTPVYAIDKVIRPGSAVASRRPAPAPTYGIQVLLNKIKSAMKLRGASGFVGLQRKFRVMDDNGNKGLDLAEFKKGIKESGIQMPDNELRILFDHFDADNSGSISFEEFLQGIREPLSPNRLSFVKMAYDKLDRDGNGIVNAEEIANTYDASRHPDVISGRRSAQAVLTEFLDTFDVGGVTDGMVTEQEFINYYTNLGASIDNEDYFELMIRNAWNLTDTNNYKPVESSFVRESPYKYHSQPPDDHTELVRRLKMQNTYASHIPLPGAAAKQEDPMSPNTTLTGRRRQGIDTRMWSHSNILMSDPSQKPNRNKSPTRSRIEEENLNSSSLASLSRRREQGLGNADQVRLSIILQDLREQLAARGAKGIIGLQRKFRIMDDNGNQIIGIHEFKKAIKECGLDLTDAELSVLFKHFDNDSNGGIDFEEFLQGVKGPMNERRKGLVALAFDVLDKNGNGVVEPDDIINSYDANRHPEVLSGQKTAQEVLRDFLDTFDVGGVIDGKVTKAEFLNYYSNIGASIDSDDYFELMIRNAWHISGGEGLAANSANRRVLVTLADGSQRIEEVTNDLGVSAGDKRSLKNRLMSQGVDVSSVSLYGGDENKKSAFGFGRKTASVDPNRDTSLQFGASELTRSPSSRGRKRFEPKSQFSLA